MGATFCAVYDVFACGVYPIWDFFSDVYVHVFGYIWVTVVIVLGILFRGLLFSPRLGCTQASSYRPQVPRLRLFVVLSVLH